MRGKAMNRRHFLQGAAALAMAAWACPARAVGMLDLKEKAHWRMLVPWGPGMEFLRAAADRFARRVSLLTQSRLAIDVYAGARVVSAAQALEAVSKGEMDCVHCSPGLWTDAAPALEWFSGTPFGLDAAGHAAWFYGVAGKDEGSGEGPGEGLGDGLKLWTEACEPLNVYPLPLGDAGPRLLGWSGRAVRSVDDLAGLRAAMPGLAGAVLAKVGALVNTAPESASGPPLASLAAGRLDLVHSMGAWDDVALGAPGAAGHAVVAPGFLPSRRICLLVNRESYNGMHPVLRRIVDAAAAQEDLRLSAAFARANAEAMGVIRADPAVTVHRWGEADLARLRDLSRDATATAAARSPLDARIRASLEAVRALLAVS